MNCTYSESLLALYAQCELPESQQRAIGLHLPSCASCRECIDELREVRSALHSFRHDTVSSLALSTVRQHIWNELPTLDASNGWALRIERALYGGKRRMIWASLAVGGVVSALACILLWQLPGSGNSPAPPSRIATMLKVDASSAAPLEQPKHTVPTKAATLTKPLTRHMQIVAKSEYKPNEILMELQTNDPSVVIYWLVDQTANQKEDSQ